jgi:hypothetical protein
MLLYPRIPEVLDPLDQLLPNAITDIALNQCPGKACQQILVSAHGPKEFSQLSKAVVGVDARKFGQDFVGSTDRGGA